MARWLGFEFPGTEIYEDENGLIRQCDGGEDPTCSLKWWWRPWTWGVKDHFVQLGEIMMDPVCEPAEFYDWISRMK